MKTCGCALALSACATVRRPTMTTSSIRLSKTRHEPAELSGRFSAFSSTWSRRASRSLTGSTNRDGDAELDRRGHRSIVIERGKEPPVLEPLEQYLI